MHFNIFDLRRYFRLRYLRWLYRWLCRYVGFIVTLALSLRWLYRYVGFIVGFIVTLALSINVKGSEDFLMYIQLQKPNRKKNFLIFQVIM